MEQFNIYLIGGMSKYGKDNFEIGNEWRRYIKLKLENCECKNFNVKCTNPQDYYSFLDDTTYDSNLEVMEFDLHKVRHSDLCICNFNDPGSLGSMAELAICYEHRIPVVGLCENDERPLLHPWQVEMCLKIFNNREDLLFYISKYYL